MKKIAIIFFLSNLLLVFYACSKFEEINTDPNQTSKVSAELLATNLILGTVRYPGVGKDFLYKDMFAKYISYMEGATSYQYNKIERTGFGSLINLTNVEKMNEAAKGSVYEDSYLALGKFLRAYAFYNLTIAVGDIPYSEALLGESSVYNPKYDSQKDVFIGILNELEEASALFGTGKDFPGDPIYKGVVKKWQKVTNAFELKVLTHLMKKTSDPDLKVIERFNAIVTSNQLMTSNSDNFQLVYSSVKVEYYPFYNSSFRSYPIMSTTIVDKMKEYEDYRLFYFANPAAAQISAGKLVSDWDAYVGVDPSDDFSSIGVKYSAKQISGINQRYYALDKGEPTYLLSYPEQCFIISEGILRGWTNGDAQVLYEAGIRSAMLFVANNTPNDVKYHHNMKITTATSDTYIAGPLVAFTGTVDEKLQKIYQQRYFLGFMQDGWNTYYEYRRTGYPVLPINPLTNLNSVTSQLPQRWMYPSKELSFNRANVEAAINSQYAGNDDVNELMWNLK